MLQKVDSNKPDTWNLNLWLGFLVSWMKHYFRETLQEDITCFGTTFLTKGKEISPMDLLTCTHDQGDYPNIGKPLKPPPVADLNRLALALMASYRLQKVNKMQTDYLNLIKNKFSNLQTHELLSAGEFDMGLILDYTEQTRGIVTDPKFKKVLAAFDMFAHIVDIF